MSDLTGKSIRGYELLEHIGRGGFGTVYRAYQHSVRREVAIKVITAQRANHPDFIRRFEAEARLVARLEHLHIVPLYDYWREPDGAYLIMRWLRGGSLQDSLHREVWDLPAILKLVGQISVALAVSHRHGIVHRDVKPANILFDEEKNAYLTDFGIAKDVSETFEVQPEEGFFGSPAYAAPEQVLKEAITPQTDIYSLGIVIFELLTGRLPFDMGTETGLMREHVTKPLPPLHEFRHDLPHGLDNVLRRATAKQPALRYANVLHLARDFRDTVALTTQLQNITFHSPASMSPQAGDTEDIYGSTRQLDLATAPAPSEAEETRQLTGELSHHDTMPLDFGDFSKVEQRNPYKGLQAFEETDAQDFFGRAELADQLIKRLAEKGTYARFMAIVGPSGSGKSSLVKAGIVPMLKRGAMEGADQWYYVQMTPGTAPLYELEQALSRVAVQPFDDLRHQSLLQAAKQSLPDADSRMLLFIDQFEEVFTQAVDDAERTAFLNMLVEAVTAAGTPLRIIITMRADFYDRPLLYPAFGELVRERTEVVLPLSEKEQREAINSPALRAGLTVEPALVDTMIADLRDQPGLLPLLQFTLTELFERRVGDRLSMHVYEAIGGVTGALARRADQIYRGLDAAGKAASRKIFLRLVTPGEGRDDTRRRVLQHELENIDQSETIIRLFGQYRLLTFDRDPATRAPTVELAHEAVIREWSQLRQWIDEAREALGIQRRLAQAANEWLDAELDPSFLATGGRLAQFEALSGEAVLALAADEKRYLEASLARRARDERRRRWFIAGLAAVALVALALAVIAFTQQQRANHQAAVALSRQLAVTAMTRVEDQLGQGLLLSLEALKAADTFEARSSLLTAVQAASHIESLLAGHTGEVRSLATNGQVVATGGTDNQILLWNLDTRQKVGTLAGHSNWVSGVAFSPDGQTLASASADGSLRLWDVGTGEHHGEPLAVNDAALWDVAFSPDGSTLAAAGEDGLIYLWDVAAGERTGEPLAGHSDIVFSVDFDPQGERLVSSSADGTVRIWNLAAGEQVGEALTGHGDWVFSAAFSPDGNLIVSGGADNAIRLWIASTGEPLGEPLLGHTGWVRDVAFNSEGSLLVSGSADHSVRLWDVLAQQERSVLDGHRDEVWDVAFAEADSAVISTSEDRQAILWNVADYLLVRQDESVLDMALSPDGAMLATASGSPSGAGGENIIWLWDAVTGDEIARLAGHERSVTGVAFSPDGTLLASGGADDTVRLWDVGRASARGTPLMAHSDAVLAVAFSGDGRYLASAGFDGHVWLWDVEAQRALLDEPLTGHSGAVTTVAFAPDGEQLVSGGADGTLRVWEVATGETVGAPLTGHTDEVMRVVFSPDGRILASTSRDQTVLLWDTTHWQPLSQPLAGHTNWVSAAAFHPNQLLLATGSRDQTVMLWDLETYRPLGQPFAGHTGWVSGMVFAPDGNTLYSAGQDAAIFRWPASDELWQDIACRVANRNLTPAEWAQFLPDMPYGASC